MLRAPGEARKDGECGDVFEIAGTAQGSGAVAAALHLLDAQPLVAGPPRDARKCRRAVDALPAPVTIAVGPSSITTGPRSGGRGRCWTAGASDRRAHGARSACAAGSAGP